jgi:gamma-glutamyltranspeptidase/glutathione hydrolase
VTTVSGARHAVSTPHALASRAALDTLRDGGNAVDAAVVAAAVCVVVQPFSSSLGGVGWAAVHDGATRTTEVLEMSGRLPAALVVDDLPADAGGLLDVDRLECGSSLLRSSLTPALPVGWADLLARRGTWSLPRALAPAIELAADGFAVSPLLHAMIVRSAARLARWPSSAEVFLPGGTPLAAGSACVQADLATTLRRVADHGPAEITTGRTARLLAAFYAEHGGDVGAADLAGIEVTWGPALSATFRGRTVHAAPGPLGDVAFLSGLQVLDGWRGWSGPDDPEYVHLSIESAKLVAADRREHLGETTTPATVARLLGPEHTEELRGRIGPRAAPAAPAIANRDGHTITLAVVDDAGTAVNLMQTVGSVFGTGAVATGTGVLLNSSAALSFPHGTGANRMRPGGKVEQNPCLAFVLDAGGGLRFAVGTPGGKTRVETVRQMLVDLLDFGMSLGSALDEPRFLMSPDGTEVWFEDDVPAGLRAELERRGHTVVVRGEPFGSGQAVGIDPRTGDRSAAADRRLESVARAE